MKNSKGVSLIALIITIIVIIILAAIVLSSGGDTTNKAQLAVYVNNISQYSDRVVMDSLNLKQTLSVNQQNINDAQLNYMIANGLRDTRDWDVEYCTLPAGYLMPDTLMEIYGYRKMASTSPINSVFGSVAYAISDGGKFDAGGNGGSGLISNQSELSYEIVYSYEKPPIVAYVIDDNNITGYSANPNNEDGSAGYEFYGDTNGKEYHFVTSSGHVFTLPGFAITQEDGTIQFYISNEKGAYYIVRGNSGLAIGAMNCNGDIVKEPRPILATDLADEGVWGTYSDGTIETYLYYEPSFSNLGFRGRNTIIGGPSAYPYIDGGGNSGSYPGGSNPGEDPGSGFPGDNFKIM